MQLSDRSSVARPVGEEGSVPAHLVCKACSKLHINCFQTHHGFRLCQKCVRSKLHPTSLCVCPGTTEDDGECTERMVNQATCNPDIATRRELSELTVHCPNIEAGCPEQQAWKFLEQHLKEACEFEVVTCNLCSRQVVQYRFRSDHENLLSDRCCPNFYALCPHCCDPSRSLNPQAFADHLKVCPAGQTDCKYSSIGCHAVMKRSQLNGHYSSCTDEHLEQTVKQLLARMEAIEASRIRDDANHRQVVEKMESRMKQLENEVQELREKEKHRQLLEQPSHSSAASLVRHEMRHHSSTTSNDRQSVMRSIDTVSGRVSNQQPQPVKGESSDPFRFRASSPPRMAEKSFMSQEEGSSDRGPTRTGILLGQRRRCISSGAALMKHDNMHAPADQPNSAACRRTQSTRVELKNNQL